MGHYTWRPTDISEWISNITCMQIAKHLSELKQQKYKLQRKMKHIFHDQYIFSIILSILA
jgi:hypothetical protein